MATAVSDRVPLDSIRDLLRVGEPLPFRILDAQERLLLNKGYMLLGEAQLMSLIERGAWAERELVEAERAARAASAPKVDLPPRSIFDQWEELIWDFDRLTRALARRQSSSSDLIPLLATLRTLVERDPDVALFRCIRPQDQRFALYALTHSLHCAVVVLLTAPQLGWAADKVQSLALAALTMNLSIFELQATMAEQDTPPSTRQREQIRAHPEASAALMREAGVVDPEWLQSILEHHEHQGGGGYPHGLTSVSPPAQLLRLADIYMAMVSPRAIRPALTTQAAARHVLQLRHGDPLASAMIKTVGLYPPGALVTLASGEVAVAIRRDPKGMQPLVATLSDRTGKPVTGSERRDTSQPGFAITGPKAEEKAYRRILPERVYGWIEA